MSQLVVECSHKILVARTVRTVVGNHNSTDKVQSELQCVLTLLICTVIWKVLDLRIELARDFVIEKYYPSIY